MKICLNLLAVTAGGQLTRARAFLDRFEQYAQASELLVLKERSVLPGYESRRGREVVSVGIGLGRLKALQRMTWENVKLPALLRERQVDVYLTFSHFLPWRFPKHIPSVVGVSNLAPFSELARWEERLPIRLKMALLRRSILNSARRANSVIALSTTCRQILEQYGIPASMIETIPNGVDDFWKQHNERTEGGSSPSIPSYLLYVSHFHRYKNHGRLVHAYARLPNRLRDRYTLVLVGRPYDKGYYREMLRLRERLGLSGQVVIQQDAEATVLRSLYQNATLFIFPSLIENCPNILLEAMASGAPVLCSNRPPMPEFGGDAARYVDPLDVPKLAAHIESLVGDRSGLEHMRCRSAANAQQFCWDDFVNRVVRLCACTAASMSPSACLMPSAATPERPI